MKDNRPNIPYLCRIIANRWGIYALMVGGLSLSFCAAIIIGLYVRDELTFDRFLPDADKVYLISSNYGPEGQPLVESDLVPAGVARWIRSDVPAVQKVSRLMSIEWPMMTTRRKANEHFYWADDNIFELLKLTAVRGNLKTALIDPGSLVLTERMAKAYFGRDDVIGQFVTTKDNIKLRVTAIIKDLPANTNLDREIFVSGKGNYALLSVVDHDETLLWPNCYTYVTLKPGTSISKLQAALLDITNRHWKGTNNIPVGYKLIALRDLHMHARNEGQMKPRGHWDFIAALLVVAIAIISQACINFAGLILAESNERSQDMLLCRMLGATRIDMVVKILQEALFVTSMSALVAIAAVERLLPELNEKLGLSLNLWSQPLSVLSVIGSVATLAGIISGLFPALIVSKAVSGAKGAYLKTSYHNASVSWHGWVVAQLALVIVLLIASTTMSQQWIYATRDALNFNAKNVLMIKHSDEANVNPVFEKDIRSLKGVEAVGESFGAPTTDFYQLNWITRHDGHLIAFIRYSVSPGFFQVYQVPFLAGHNIESTYLYPEAPREVIINKLASKALGFTYPRDAIGREIEYDSDQKRVRSRIVGVIPDIRFATVYEPVLPMMFDGHKRFFTTFSVKLSQSHVEQTIRQIDTIWIRDSGGAVPIERQFLDEYFARQYRDLLQQIQVFKMISWVAIILSTLGLTGLSMFLARHKSREVAILRALGATVLDIFVQRLTPFVTPFLVANIIAWPIAWIVLTSWLNSFADHVPLSPVSFASASALSILFALISVAAYSAFIARTKSASLLRH